MAPTPYSISIITTIGAERRAPIGVLPAMYLPMKGEMRGERSTDTSLHIALLHIMRITVYITTPIAGTI
jgi:hypothetical protein